MLKRVIEHVQGIAFDVEYTVELKDFDEVLKFKCYAPDGIRYAWVYRTVDTASWTGMDHDYDLRHFALAIYQIDDMPICSYLRDEMGTTLPDVLDNISDSPHDWAWSNTPKDNQVGIIANEVYKLLSKLPNEIQESLVKIFRAMLSMSLGVTHVADEFNRMDDYIKLLEQQARDAEAQQETATIAPSQQNPQAQEPPTTSDKKEVPQGMKRNEGANEDSSFFVPPHQSTREHQLAEQDRRRMEDKKDVPPEVAAAMAYTEEAMKE